MSTASFGLGSSLVIACMAVARHTLRAAGRTHGLALLRLNVKREVDWGGRLCREVHAQKRRARKVTVRAPSLRVCKAWHADVDALIRQRRVAERELALVPRPRAAEQRVCTDCTTGGWCAALSPSGCMLPREGDGMGSRTLAHARYGILVRDVAPRWAQHVRLKDRCAVPHPSHGWFGPRPRNRFWVGCECGLQCRVLEAEPFVGYERDCRMQQSEHNGEGAEQRTLGWYGVHSQHSTEMLIDWTGTDDIGISENSSVGSRVK